MEDISILELLESESVCPDKAPRNDLLSYYVVGGNSAMGS